MKTIRKLVAALLATVMLTTLFANTAFAVTRDKTADRSIALAKQALEEAKKDKLYNKTIKDPVLVYYGSQPILHELTTLKWLQDQFAAPDYVGGTKDLSYGVVAAIGNNFGGNYASKTLTTIQDTVYDILDGSEQTADKIVSRVPVVSSARNVVTDAGKLTIQAVLLPAYTVTNFAALAFVLVGGGAALVVIFALSGVLLPITALMEGPREAEQFFRDINEMEQAIYKR